MSVIVQNGELGSLYGLEEKCSLCDNELTLPYMDWQGKKKWMFLCVSCCSDLKEGFIADLIHITAIRELQKIRPRCTLRREGVKPNYRNDRRQELMKTLEIEKQGDRK
jgi:hypothetical protein